MSTSSRARRVAQVVSSVGLIVMSVSFVALLGSPGRVTRWINPEFAQGVENYVENNPFARLAGTTEAGAVFLVAQIDPEKPFIDPELDRLAKLYRQNGPLGRLLILTDHVKVVPWEYQSTERASRWRAWYAFTTTIPGLTRIYATVILSLALLFSFSNTMMVLVGPKDYASDRDFVRGSLIVWLVAPLLLLLLLGVALLLAFIGHHFYTSAVGIFCALTCIWPLFEHGFRIILGFNPFAWIGLAVNLGLYLIRFAL